MKICKYAEDTADLYCKNCNGIDMMVDGKSISCEKCNGYEPGNDTANEVNTPVETVEECPFEEDTKNNEKTTEKPAKPVKPNNNTSKAKTTENGTKNTTTNNKSEVIKTGEESKSKEISDGIKVTALRYTSSATVKREDNYFKFTAEEEWDVTGVSAEDMDDTREQLWAKLNSEVDEQIEELQNMN